MASMSKVKLFRDDQSGMISVDGLLAAAFAAIIASTGSEWKAAPSATAYIDTDAQYTQASCGKGVISKTCG